MVVGVAAVVVAAYRGAQSVEGVAAGEMIGLDKELTDFDCRLLWVLTTHLKFGNSIKLSQSDLARRMDSSRQQISRSMARLVERGYVDKGDNRTYSLSMHVGYRGNRTKRVSEIAAKKGIRLVNGEKE